jgi:hypothetical protein
MSLITHIPLAHRKALCARLIFIETTEGQRNALSQCKASAYLNRIKENLFSLTKEAIDNSPDVKQLDAFLGELSSQLRSLPLPSWDDSKVQGRVSSVMSRVEQGLGSVSCQSCSPSHICNGSDDDIVAVGNSGLCISRLKKVFEWANEAARKLYFEYATDFSSASLPEVSFSTLPYLHTPPGVPNGWSLGGATQYFHAAKRRISRVELSLVTQDFDRRAYLACPYVLFHECVCHIFRWNCENVEPSEPDSYFAEGWMDWIASETLPDFLRGQGGASGSEGDNRLGFLRATVDITRELHRSRTNTDGPVIPPFATARETGKEAADRMLYLLERLLPSPEEAWSRFLTTSLDLVLSPYSNKDLDAFAWAILNGLPAREVPERPEQARPIQIVRKYIQTSNLHEMVGGILFHYSLDK